MGYNAWKGQVFVSIALSCLLSLHKLVTLGKAIQRLAWAATTSLLVVLRDNDATGCALPELFILSDDAGHSTV